MTAPAPPPGAAHHTDRAGARIPLELVRARAARRAAEASRLPADSGPVDLLSRPAIRYYFLHSVYTQDTAVRSSYDPIMLEASIALSYTDLHLLEQAMLSQLARVEVVGSGREIWSTAQPAAGTVETDGLLLASRFRRGGYTHVRNVLGLTPEWSPRAPYTARRDDLDRAIASLTAAGGTDQGLPDLRAARARVDRERLESWTTDALTYALREGTQRPALSPGAYDLGLSSLRHLQSWDSWDTANFKITEAPNYYAAESSLPAAVAATNEHREFDIFSAPQYWEYLIQWYDLYLIGTLFFVSLVAIPNTGVFVGPLPILPKPYRLSGSAQNAANSVAVSAYVARTNAYARMREQALAIQTFSPFFFIFYVGSIGGRVTLMQLNQPARTLCARVDTPVGAARVTRYVWRRTELVRPNVIVDQVPLNVLGEVVGDDTLFVES